MKTRFTFVKTGSMRFIGHLDLMRFFQKAIRRAKLDVSYSKGYSPHQLMSFASPLGVGMTGDGEVIDVEFQSLPEGMDGKSLCEYLNRFMTDEIFVTDFEIMPDSFKSSMAKLVRCDYLVSMKDTAEPVPEFHKKFAEYMAQEEIRILKKTKRSETEMDVRPHIHAYAFEREEFEQQTGRKLPAFHGIAFQNPDKVYMQLSAGSAVNIKPELVLNDFFHRTGYVPEPYCCHTHRLDMYFED